MKLYHGSTSLFNSIDVKKGKGYKDFGKGFYATESIRHAEKIALRNKEILIKRQEVINNRNPKIKLSKIKAYRYNLDFNEDINDLNIKIFNKANEEWLKFVIANRQSPVLIHDYDIVVGPTADAQTTMIINEYLDELIETNFSEKTCRKVISKLKPENLPKQYFFGIEKSIKKLSLIKRQEVKDD